MKNDDVMRLCQSLARRYNDPQEYDDLVSEGLLAAYELIEQGKTDKNLIYSHVQREMNDYYNIKRSIVSVPSSGPVHSMSKESEVKTWSDSAIYNALYGDVVAVEDNMLRVKSSEDVYEQKEWFAHVLTVAVTHLKEEEWKIIKLRYWQDMTQDEVADILETSKMSISRKEKAALEKIRNNL